MKYTENKQN